MANKGMRGYIQWLSGASLCITAGFALAAQPAATDPAMKRYLDCINGSAKLQQAQGSDKLSNAQSVISSCENEKQALLKALPDQKTSRIVARIEQHLKSRERPK